MTGESIVAPRENGRTAWTERQGPTGLAEMEAVLDELTVTDVQEHHVPVAALSVVKDGVLFFAKGDGYADLENKIRVGAEQTILPTGLVRAPCETGASKGWSATG